MKYVTAVVGPELTIARLDMHDNHLVLEDDTDRAIVQLSPGIAREIIEKLSTYLLATDRGVQS
jgi:hypothetical protein